MAHTNTIKIILVSILVNLSSQLYGQTDEVGIIKGKTIDKKTGDILPFVNLFTKLKSGEKIATQSNVNGIFELEIPTGKHTLKVKHLGYLDYMKEVEVNSNDTLEYEISICSSSAECRPWDRSLPYPELSGFWKPVSYFDGNSEIDQSKRKDKAGLSVYFINDTLPGKLAWNNGCNHYYIESLANNECPPHFRNLGNGIIEVHNKGGIICRLMTLEYKNEPKPVKCNNVNKEWETFMSNIHGKKFATAVTNEEHLLSISYEDEKFILRKIHNYTQPEFSTELFGKWLPVKGKLSGKKIEKFADDAEIIFDRKNGNSNYVGAIQYKDEEDCVSEIYLNYQYMDEDFISITSSKWPANEFHEQYKPAKDKICKHEKLTEAIHNSFSQYGGCHIQFNETKDLVTLKYDEDYLVLKRKE